MNAKHMKHAGLSRWQLVPASDSSPAVLNVLPQALAQTNAAVLRHAARALIRNCDTLGLMRRSTRGSAPARPPPHQLPQQQLEQQGAPEGDGSEDGSEDAEEALAGMDAGRIAALLCFDEMQVRRRAFFLLYLLQRTFDLLRCCASTRCQWVAD